MAKLDLDYLKKKYGKTGWTGGKYRELVSHILERNQKYLSTQTFEANEKKLASVVMNAKDNKLKQIVTPRIHNIVKGDIILRKAADRGKIITNTLRDKILDDLQSVFSEHKMVIPTGPNAGQVNNKAVVAMEQKLMETFDGYTKKNAKFGGVPSNIHTIAVTEVRGVINDSRDKYIREILDKNPSTKIEKEWVHNKSLSKTPRLEHLHKNGEVIDVHDYFIFPDGTKLRYPHDPSGPPEHIIGCNCECRYRLVTV